MTTYLVTITSAWGVWKHALHHIVQSNTRNVWNTKRYHNTIVKQKLMHSMTHKICPLREHLHIFKKKEKKIEMRFFEMLAKRFFVELKAQ